MAITQELYGSNRDIPQDTEEDWGTEVTGVLVDLAKGCDSISGLAGTVVVPKLSTSTLAMAAGGTIPSVGGTVTKSLYRVAGSGGAVTLGSVAIANGSIDGQRITVMGTSDANTVTIVHNSNTFQNGDIVLSDGDAITYIWNNSGSQWEEISRTS